MSVWWTYWFRSNIFLWVSTNISIGRRFWSNGPMDWLPSLLIMLIILQSGSERANFRDFKDFDDFEAVFHQIFTGSSYLCFTKSGALTVIFAHALNALKRLDSRFLRGASWLLFCIMHALLLPVLVTLQIYFDLMLPIVCDGLVYHVYCGLPLLYSQNKLHRLYRVQE
jgi:hypothetical protein